MPIYDIYAQYSLDRFNMCLGVYRQIVDDRLDTGEDHARIIADAPIADGVTLGELAERRFLVGIGEQLTDVQFLDLLIVFEAIRQDTLQREQHRQSKAEGDYKVELSLKPAFEKAHAFSLLEAMRPYLEVSENGLPS